MNKNQKHEESEASKDMICICCPIGCALHVERIGEMLDVGKKGEKDEAAIIKEAEKVYKVSGNKCPRGKKYAIEEMIAPKRIVTSTVRIDGGLYSVISVKTAAPIPKEKIFAVMDVLSDVTVTAPIKIGDVVVHNVAGTGVDVVATKNAG